MVKSRSINRIWAWLRFDWPLARFEVELLLAELTFELEVLLEPKLLFELFVPLLDWLAFPIAATRDKARAKFFTN